MLKRLLVLIVLLGLTLPATVPVFSQEKSAFPVTIKHKFGETTFEKAPERVVAIGYTEQDFLLALGIKPVAVRYWYGDAPNAIFPWAVEAADGATPFIASSSALTTLDSSGNFFLRNVGASRHVGLDVSGYFV